MTGEDCLLVVPSKLNMPFSTWINVHVNRKYFVFDKITLFKLIQETCLLFTKAQTNNSIKLRLIVWTIGIVY